MHRIVICFVLVAFFFLISALADERFYIPPRQSKFGLDDRLNTVTTNHVAKSIENDIQFSRGGEFPYTMWFWFVLFYTWRYSRLSNRRHFDFLNIVTTLSGMIQGFQKKNQ